MKKDSLKELFWLLIILLIADGFHSIASDNAHL